MTTETRRRVAWGGQAGACSLKVPVYGEPEGDVIEGMFHVSARLANTAPDTNERHELERITRENFDRWSQWRAKRGWEYVNGSLQVNGPYNEPTFSARDETDTDTVQFRMLARFKRTAPIFVGLDDVLQIREMAETYGVGANPMPWNQWEGKDSGWVDPLEYAKERRERLGLKRGDFLLGPLDEPL
jgi:hypothetical protein